MTRPVPVRFSSPPVIDRVSVALAPMDAFTGAPVARGVTAWLWDAARKSPQPYRVIRNLSGQLVFINLPPQVEYAFAVDGSSAGYFGPLTVAFQPPAQNDPRSANERLRRVVLLQRRPDAVQQGDATLVRGMVVRGPAAQADVGVSAVPATAGAPAFETVTDARGAFVLLLRLPPQAADAPPAPVDTTLRFEQAAAPARELTVQLLDGRAHVFEQPIDLDGSAVPPFAF